MTLDDIRSRLAAIDSEQNDIENAASRSSSGRFSASQQSRYDALDSEWKNLKQQEAAIMATDKPQILPRRTPDHINTPMRGREEGFHMLSGATYTGGKGGNRSMKFCDMATGEPLEAYAPNESMSEHYQDSGELSFGRFAIGFATGNWRNAANEYATLTTSTATSHSLVPEQFLPQVIDLMRANLVVRDWGATTLLLDSDTATIAKVTADPTVYNVGEGKTITESKTEFGHIRLTPVKVAALIKMSRELAEDAPNSGELVEQTLVAALARKIDEQILTGSGSNQITGITNTTGIGSTTSVGAISWETLHNSVVSLQANNHQPNGYVLSPTIHGDLAILTSGDGTNSAKMWLPAPSTVEPLRRLSTTAIGDTIGIVGDGTKIIVGIRRSMRIEFTTEADGTFEKDQLAIKITMRFDAALTHAEAMHKLTGITT